MKTVRELRIEAQALNDKELYNDCITLLPDALLANYQSDSLYAIKAEALYMLGEKDLCDTAATNAIAINRDNVMALTYKAFVYADKKQYNKAITLYEKILLIDPLDFDAHTGLGDVYVTLQEYEKAITFYKRSLYIDQTDADTHFNLGNAYFYLKRYDEAIAAYEKAIFEEPNDIDSYLGLTEVYSELKQYEKVLATFDRAIEINSIDENIWCALGSFYSDQKEYTKAINALEKSISLNDNNSECYNELGGVYSDLDESEKAIVAFKRGIEVDPNFVDCYYNLAMEFFILKQYGDSLTCFKRFVELYEDKNDFYGKLALEKIIELEKILRSAHYGEINEIIQDINEILSYNGDCITHYTSLTVANTLILDQNPFRISEGAFLNDTSEGRELFKFLEFYQTNLLLNDTVAKPFAQRPFIGSFVAKEKHDNLSLWRMYGKQDKEDAKGCTITIGREAFLNGIEDAVTNNSREVNSEFTNEDFSFFYVAYRLDDNTSNEDVFIVPGFSEKKRKALNNKMNALKNKIAAFNESNKDYQEKQNIQEVLNQIAYLFKTAEYQHEQELRLVVKGTGFKKIVDKGIGRVYIELVKINPLISGITLGPKVEKAEEVAAMFHYALDEELNYASGSNKPPEILISRLPFK